MNQRGITMIEVLLYLGLSGMVLTFFGGMVLNMTRQQTLLADQQHAQEIARNTLSTITYAARNAYHIEIQPGQVDFYAEPDTNPVITRMRYENNALLIGNAVGTPPNLISVIDADATVTNATFQTVSSALQVSLTIQVGTQSQSIHSTIAYRQGR
ncbi:MAG: hypothetical protein WCV86_02095 [Patescibacteria group bacterium]|jgi:Tfp pilus assembly protein PilW